jgi:drug/metabolite transporter (DMT)-like permease
MLPTFALSLVLGGAVLHASWNLLLKQSINKAAFMAFSVVVSVLVFAPVALWATPPQMFPALLPILVISGAAEIGYMIALSKAYEHGDLSLVYPLARGSAPFFVFAWSSVVLGEQLPFFGYVGVTLMIVGIYLTTLPTLRDWLRPIRSLESVSSRWALLSGLCIATYTLADRDGARLISPWMYNLYIFTIMALGSSLYVVLTRHRLTAQIEWRTNWLSIVSTGVINVVNYMVVLWALTLAPTSYVSALRGTSIVMSSFYGWRVRGERISYSRMLGALFSVLGIVSLALGG